MEICAALSLFLAHDSVLSTFACEQDGSESFRNKGDSIDNTQVELKAVVVLTSQSHWGYGYSSKSCRQKATELLIPSYLIKFAGNSTVESSLYIHFVFKGTLPFHHHQQVLSLTSVDYTHFYVVTENLKLTLKNRGRD